MSRLRLAFMGTPEFAVPALAALKRAGHAIAAVYTQPARKAGRGQRSQASPVARFAAAHELPLRTPANLRLGAEAAQFEALALDAAVVAAYGLILPNTFLASPRLGCLNIHASLLPRWRGAAPIARAILAGDRESGVTIMKMDDTLDTGAILLKESVAIEPTMTAGELHDALAALGARLIVPALDGIAAGRLEPKPQPGQGISYAPKIDKAETRLDWRRPALMLERQVRAFAPVPGAWCELAGARVRVLAAETHPNAVGARPGTLLDERLTIATAAGALRLLRLQRAGGTAMAAADYLRGTVLAAGTVLP
jgi:methionyl-tRNA formyltransferase